MYEELLTAEERAQVDAAVSLAASNGATAGMQITPDWFFEEPDDFQDRMTRLMCFMLYYFPRTFREWEPINDYLYNFLEQERQGMAWLPAGHGKTTMIQRWFIWVALQEPDISIIYTEKNLPTALKRSRAVRMILEENRLLRDHFGEFKPPPGSSKPWADEQFTIRQREAAIDTPTLAVFGAGGGSLLGNRCNILVVDDPVTPENSNSERERAMLKQWFTEAAATSPYPLPLGHNERYLVKLFLIGTVFRLDDLYHDMLATGDFAHLYLKSVEDEQTGRTLSPRFCFIDPKRVQDRARTTPYYAELQRKLKRGEVINLFEFLKTKGRMAFNRRYQNIAINEETQLVKPEWVYGGGEGQPGAPPGGYDGCLDKKRSIGHKEPDWVCVTGCDPQSGSGSKASKRFAAVTLGAKRSEPGRIYLIDLRYGQYPLESENASRQTQTSHLLDLHAKYGGTIVIEANATQRGWQDVIRAAASRRGQVISVRGHQTGGNKKDPEIGIRSMAALFENGAIRIPYRAASDKRATSDFIDEFIYYGVFATSDIVMATWFAWVELTKQLRGAGAGTADIPAVTKDYVSRRDRWVYPSFYTEEMITAHQRALRGEKEDAA